MDQVIENFKRFHPKPEAKYNVSNPDRRTRFY